jgi:hypothetical protein
MVNYHHFTGFKKICSMKVDHDETNQHNNMKEKGKTSGMIPRYPANRK